MAVVVQKINKKIDSLEIWFQYKIKMWPFLRLSFKAAIEPT